MHHDYRRITTLYQKCWSSMEAIGKACGNGFDVTKAYCQLVSLISTLEQDKWIEEFDWKNDKYPVYKRAHNSKQSKSVTCFKRYSGS